MNNVPASPQIADEAAYAAAVELAVTASTAYYGDGSSTLDDDVFDPVGHWSTVKMTAFLLTAASAKKPISSTKFSQV